MQRIGFRKIYSILVFLTIWVYFSLNTRIFNLPGSHLLRWIFPICLVLLAIKKNNKKIAVPPWIFWIFSIAVLPSIILSSYQVLGIVKYFSWILILYGSYIFFKSLTNEKDFKNCFWILIWILILFQILNFINVVLGINYDSGRALGITTNANTLGVYSNLAYWSIFYVMRKVKKKSMKVVLFFLWMSAILTAIASGSRTAFVVLILNILLSIIFLFRKRPFFILYIGLIIVGAYLILSGSLNSLNITALNRLMEEGTSRGEFWNAAISLWEQSPIFGVGYTVSNLYNLLEPGMAFHNSYISFLAECGVWGAVLLVCGMLALGARVFNNLKKDTVSYEFLIVVVMVLNLMIAAWSESFMFAVGSTEGFTFWFLIAWIIAYRKQYNIL